MTDSDRCSEDVVFYDKANDREMLLVRSGYARGWLCYKNAGGNWVTLREATEGDLRIIHETIINKEAR